MSRMNHDANNLRHVRSELQREANYERARKSGQDLNAAEQAKYRAIAERYSNVNTFCAEITQRGRWITQKQAAALGRIAAEQRGQRTSTQPKVSFSGGVEMTTRQMTAEEMGRM